MEDSQILDLYWNRNEDAIRQTDIAYGVRLLGLAYRITDNREDSQECVSDTYMKAWNSIPPQRPVYFFAYLAKICRHLAFGILDYRNAARRKADVVSLTSEMELCIPDSKAEASLEAEQIGELLNRFLEQLPKDSRILFLRRYWFADSIEEAASHCGISLGAAKTRLHRTRAKLRQFLESEGVSL